MKIELVVIQLTIVTGQASDIFLDYIDVISEYICKSTYILSHHIINLDQDRSRLQLTRMLTYLTTNVIFLGDENY